ncbi:MAG: hypothetical protein JO235_14740, partial [Chroococcidiopsidaceae cyanobacterium CP_BM_RX_35]|nr:hypothetical protein [Chroococcidiopsidaceae cyanobacterium CP_BM_RX_35]
LVSAPLTPATLPIPQPHPLPPELAQWQDNTNSGDYFAQVQPTAVGYLIWSQFPVRVYIESAVQDSDDQAQRWVRAVLSAVQEWSVYLPLVLVEQPAVADIVILQWRSPLRLSPRGELQRVRTAETSYELYTSKMKDTPAVLSHRCTIKLSPRQIVPYLQASARHELGHALGIWGHSQVATDVMYFSQVRNPPPISTRDINTLKRIYEQPTRLGWSLR